MMSPYNRRRQQYDNMGHDMQHLMQESQRHSHILMRQSFQMGQQIQATLFETSLSMERFALDMFVDKFEMDRHFSVIAGALPSQ